MIFYKINFVPPASGRISFPYGRGKLPKFGMLHDLYGVLLEECGGGAAGPETHSVRAEGKRCSVYGLSNVAECPYAPAP